VQGAGTLFVGSGKVGGRDFGLVVVAPGCRRAADVVVPEEARQPGRALVALLLGEPADDLPVAATVSAAVLGADLGTLDGAALERALDAVPLTVSRGETKCLFFCRESPKGRPIDEAEYERLHRADVRKGFDIFIDLLLAKVWRRGRACGLLQRADTGSPDARMSARQKVELANVASYG
jgi:hypothetical protein